MTVNSTEMYNMESTVQEVVDNPSVIKEYLHDIMPSLCNFGFKLAISIVVLFVGLKLIKSVVKVINKSMDKAGVEASVNHFLCALFKYIFEFILIMFILSGYGLSGSIIAILGSAGLTVGLALQGSLANFAGGVLIIVLKPFKIGDYIIDSSSGKEGVVSEISIFYTKLLTVDNKMIMIPNGALANATITNVSMQEKRRVDIKVGVAYTSDLALVKEILKDIATKDSDVLKNEPIDIFVDELAESSINMALRVWVNNENYFPVKWRITEAIKLKFDEKGVEIPYPHMNIIVDKTN